ncbi:MAG: type II secretion system F family protein [bacterium]|nr:type II secretion system F family protein [bacterium]
MWYLLGALFFFFLAIFFFVYHSLVAAHPSAEYGHKLTLMEHVKVAFAIQKQLMKITLIKNRMNSIWVRLGKPVYPLPEDIVVLKLLLMIIVFAFFWVVGITYGAFMFAVVAFFIPDIYYARQASARLREVERAFPATLDLLTLCVDAGMDFMAAITKIIENSEDNPLMQEFQEIMRETQLGSDRKQTLKNFSERCDLDIVNSFVSVVIQAEELGTSLSSVLEDYSQEMKEKRFQSAEKQAMEAPVKMLIPMMIFIFPGVFILIFGPISIKIMEII